MLFLPPVSWWLPLSERGEGGLYAQPGWADLLYPPPERSKSCLLRGAQPASNMRFDQRNRG